MPCMVVLNDFPKREILVKYLSRVMNAKGLMMDHNLVEAGIIICIPTQNEVELEATKLQLMKPLRMRDELDEFDIDTRHSYKGVDDPGFFKPFEISYIGEQLINDIMVDDEFMQLAKHFGWEGHHDERLHADDHLMISLQRLGLVDFITPVHNHHEATKTWNATRSQLLTPVDAVRDYYGEKVAMYYAWMNYLTIWMIVPGILGGLLHLEMRFSGVSVDDNHLVPFFSLFIVIWAVSFIKSWRRQAMILALEWNTLEFESVKVIRPEFRGTIGISPITGAKERQYPARKRFYSYILSVAVTSVLMSMVFVLIVCSLNFQGYIQDKEIFYIPSISKYSAEGAIFSEDANFILALVPTIIHVLMITTINSKIYRPIAEFLTQLENHETEEQHENSLILKRFLFEGFDTYAPLLYLAFVECNVLKVRKELQSVFLADCIRRFVTEVGIPALISTFKRSRNHVLQAQKKKDQEKPNELHVDALTDKEFKEEYEEFDDYLEMVIQFGYVTMFAAAFPGAAFISVFYNVIEMKQDMVKLCFVLRRASIIRVKSIGTWQFVITAQAWLSVLTNVILFSWSSGYMTQWFPGLFDLQAEHVASLPVEQVEEMMQEGRVALGQGRYVLGFAMLIEHALLLIMLIITFVVPDVPESVDQELKKREYEREQVFKKMKHERRERIMRVCSLGAGQTMSTKFFGEQNSTNKLHSSFER